MYANVMKALTVSMITGLALSGQALANSGNLCYDVQRVNVIGADGIERATSWFGINNENQVVGNYCVEAGCAFLGGEFVGGAIYDLDDGSFVTFTLPGSPLWVGNVSINDHGVITGETVLTGQSFTRAVDGTITYLTPPTGASTVNFQAGGINNAGTIVGTYEEADTIDHGWILDGSTYTFYDVVNDGETFLRSINDAGTLAGTFRRTGKKLKGFVDYGSSVERFRVYGSTAAIVQAINQSDVVVGYGSERVDNANEAPYAPFIYDDGFVQLLDVPNPQDTATTGINDAMIIVGTDAGFEDGLIFTPTNCANDPDNPYVKINNGTIVTNPGQSFEVVVQYGNTSGQTVHDVALQCKWPKGLGDLGATQGHAFSTITDKTARGADYVAFGFNRVDGRVVDNVDLIPGQNYNAAFRVHVTAPAGTNGQVACYLTADGAMSDAAFATVRVQ